MITNLVTPVIHRDNALNGIRRSRFSFHFNTARKRRWLMVQLVTAPTLTDPSVEQTEHPTPYAALKPERTDYHHMIDRFQAGCIGTRCI